MNGWMMDGWKGGRVLSGYFLYTDVGRAAVVEGLRYGFI